MNCFLRAFILLSVWVTMTATADMLKDARQAMVADIERHVLETAGYIGTQQLDPRVIRAMAEVPRHEFVAESYQHMAYRDSPLPIGYQQTISQPYIVALMTHLIRPQADDRVLEIGTGSGYQAAVLSLLVSQVYSIEIIEPLAMSAQQDLQKLGYSNVLVVAGNGYAGLPQYAPFDAIVVTAGGDVPPALIEQLKPGGRMVIPVQDQSGMQHLTLYDKTASGELITRRVLPVRFVPLIGEENDS